MGVLSNSRPLSNQFLDLTNWLLVGNVNIYEKSATVAVLFVLTAHRVIGEARRDPVGLRISAWAGWGVNLVTLGITIASASTAMTKQMKEWNLYDLDIVCFNHWDTAHCPKVRFCGCYILQNVFLGRRISKVTKANEPTHPLTSIQKLSW